MKKIVIACLMGLGLFVGGCEKKPAEQPQQPAAGGGDKGAPVDHKTDDTNKAPQAK